MLLMGHGCCADWSLTLQIVLKKVSFNDFNRLCDTANVIDPLPLCCFFLEIAGRERSSANSVIISGVSR